MAQTFHVSTVGNGRALSNVMALDANAVYALYQPWTPQASAGDVFGSMLAKIDRKTGTVYTAGPFPGAVSLAVAGGFLWIAGGYFPGHADASFLDRLSPLTLSVEERLPLPLLTGQNSVFPTLAGSSTSLWMGFGPALYQLSSNDGHIIALHQIGTDAAVTSLSINPAGTILYLGANRCSITGPMVYEWSAVSGALLASSSAAGGQCLGGVQVAAAADGVWLSFATGMMGAVGHLRARDLQPLPFVGERHTNDLRVFVAAGVIWTTDGMLAQLSCADPKTGAVRATTTLPYGGVVIGDSLGVYLGAWDGVSLLRPDPACGAP